MFFAFRFNVQLLRGSRLKEPREHSPPQHISMSSTVVNFGLLPPKRTVFLLCDIQDKYRPEAVYFNEIVESASKLCQAAKILDIPLLVTEQKLETMGKTVSELDISHAEGVYEKTKLSMLTPAVTEKLDSLCKGNVLCVVLFGLETHITIEQSAAELRALGLQVHVVADSCTSRTQEDRLLALKRLQQIGCFITTTESVLFKCLADQENPNFTKIQSLLRSPISPTGLTSL